MAIIYNFGILLYTLAIHLAAPFNRKARLWVQGRRGQFSAIRNLRQGGERIVWFHAASLGEFEQGRPVMEALKAKDAGIKIVLTFFSPSGYEVRKNYPGADHILYLPADTPQNAARFIKYLRPDAAVFIKYEFWYNYLRLLHRKGIPTFLISAVFRKEQPFFRPWGGLHRRMLHFFRMLFLQDEKSVDLLDSIGISHFLLTGDTRFDRVKQLTATAHRLERIEQFCQSWPIVVCGSTWPADEELLLSYIHTKNHVKWIIAPHEIEEHRIRNIAEKCRKNVAKYSDPQTELVHAEVLIIDCIGLLSAIYRYGQIAYIGGGFGAGIHNTLEAAVYGIPVIFGPKYRKFNEALSLIREGGAFSIRSQEELNGCLDSLLQNASLRQTAGEKAGRYVESQLGATTTILTHLKQYLT